MMTAASHSIKRLELPNILNRFALLRLENILLKRTHTKAYTELISQSKTKTKL